MSLARVELEDNRLTVHLRPLDEILALHGSLHIPYTHIRAVRADEASWRDAWSAFRIGTNIPHVELAGTFITGHGTIFYDFHNPKNCLTLDLAHERYDQVVVEVDHDQDHEELAREIQDKIAAAEPAQG